MDQKYLNKYCSNSNKAILTTLVSGYCTDFEAIPLTFSFLFSMYDGA